MTPDPCPTTRAAAATEGVVKFHCEHDDGVLDPRLYGEVVCRLVAWREILALTGLVGRDPERYGGAAYGNVSARVGRPSAGRGRRAFLVTGTGTSGKRRLGLSDFARVDRWETEANRVRSRGPVRPSSESMSHGAAYDLGPWVRCVFHVHSPVLWRRAEALGLPVTSPSVPYGTPAMAREVERLGSSGLVQSRPLLAMGGHEDGLLAFGRSPEEVGKLLLEWLARAYEAECRA